MTFNAKVIEDSVNKFGVRAISMELTFPTIILAELNTHRMFSRSSSSQRAIPMKTLLKQVWNNPFVPVYWGKNVPGMQAKQELSGIKLEAAKIVWVFASRVACLSALALNALGLHKQIGNRVLSPWLWTRTIVTSTEWDNFFNLRLHPDAQPEFYHLAELMAAAIDASVPKYLLFGEWHLPYVLDGEREKLSLEKCIKVSTARCARVSYLTHDGKSTCIEKDIELHDLLIEMGHMSPLEHSITVAHKDEFYFNIKSYKSYRWYAEEEPRVLRKIFYI